jgi:hypothetical protein
MKQYLTKLALVAVVGIAGAGFLGADQWDKKTVITTDEVMQVPNATLQPGTYVIRLAESSGNRHIVQIFDQDEKHLVTTILAIPNQRLQPTGKSVFAFWEVPAGQPKALRAWFYPGDNFGQEFAYPKTEATQITASNSGATVPVSDEKVADLTVADSSTTTAAEPTLAPVAAAPAEPAPPAAAPEVAVVQEPAPAPVVDAQPPATADRDDAQRLTAQNTAPQTAAPESLPTTASNLPLLGLIGLLSICGAVVTRKLAYRRG